MTGKPETGRDRPFRSPSGLLTRAAWEAELEMTYDHLPAWHRSPAEENRRFLQWVHSEARGLAAHLERLIRVDTDPDLADHLRAVIDALTADAEWARKRIDGRVGEAA